MKLLIIVFFIAGLLISCKYHCGGFPEEELKWIPFELNDTILYSNQYDTVYFIIDDYWKSEDYSYKGFLIMDLFCSSQGYFQTDYNNKLNCSLKQLKSVGNTSAHDYDLEIYFSGLDSFKIHQYGITHDFDSVHVKYIADTVIDNKHIIDSYFLTQKNNLTNHHIDSLFVAPNFGIIKFYDIADKLFWKRIDY